MQQFTSEIKGDILSAQCGFIIHGCNATTLPVGGLAKVIFERYPEAEDAHHQLVNRLGDQALGNISLVAVSPDLFIVNAVTQSLPGAGSFSYYALMQCCSRINNLAHNYEQLVG